MSTVAHTTYTPDDLLTMPDGERYELVDGELVEKEVGAMSDYIATEICALLSKHVRSPRLGRVFGSQTGYRCFPADPDLVRKPDGSFIAERRLPGGKIPAGHISILPDLAIEVVSPNDRYYEVDAKVHLYREAGIPLIWVINPDNRTVKVYDRSAPSPLELTVADTLRGGSVLPDFSVPVAELFPPN